MDEMVFGATEPRSDWPNISSIWYHILFMVDKCSSEFCCSSSGSVEPGLELIAWLSE